MTSDIMVSIACITYNHEKFIAKALQGFVSQKTSYKLEIIIADDHSTDSTPTIIKDYYKRYPELIKPILRDLNIGSRKNALETLRMCNGDYIALCEGDDFWIDDRKIQKQVDFLENNPGFVMCTHNVKVEFDNVARINPLKKPLKVSKFEDIVSYGHFIPTLSVVYRKSALPDIPKWYLEAVSGDILLELLVLNKGKNYFMDDVMGVKRKHPGGITQKRKNINKNVNIFKDIEIYKKLNKYSNYKHNKIIKFKISNYYFKIISIYWNKKKFIKIIIISILSFWNSPISFIKNLQLSIKKKYKQ